MLVLTLARLRIGANFGNRAPIHGQYIRTQFTPEGLQHTQQLLKDERHLNDEPGLSVYLSDQKPKFIAFAPLVAIAKNPDNVKNTFVSGLTQGRPLIGRERVAFDRFFASFFQSSADVPPSGAVEALIEPQLKSKEAVAYIDEFIAQIKCADIAEAEKASLIGSLNNYVRYESINQAGKRFAEHILGNRTLRRQTCPGFLFLLLRPTEHTCPR